MDSKKSPNDVTIAAYNSGADAYISRTPSHYTIAHVPLTRWIDSMLLHALPHAQILEIGSGTPRDAQYIRKQGYEVTTTDAAESFIRLLRQQGEAAKRLNILKDPVEKGYDVIFANAVVQHFTLDDFKLTLQKIYDALPKGGLFALSTKQGKGEVWINEKMQQKRFVHYWQPHDLYDFIEAAGYELVYTESDVLGDLPGHILIHIIARKP